MAEKCMYASVCTSCMSTATRATPRIYIARSDRRRPRRGISAYRRMCGGPLVARPSALLALGEPPLAGQRGSRAAMGAYHARSCYAWSSVARVPGLVQCPCGAPTPGLASCPARRVGSVGSHAMRDRSQVLTIIASFCCLLLLSWGLYRCEQCKPGSFLLASSGSGFSRPVHALTPSGEWRCSSAHHGCR